LKEFSHPVKEVLGTPDILRNTRRAKEIKEICRRDLLNLSAVSKDFYPLLKNLC